MGWREVLTAVLTALAVPLGSVLFGFGLSRLGDATTGGMAGLAGGVVGLWLGGPFLALVVFGICLVTLLRSAPVRHWLALAIMVAFSFAEVIIVLLGLGFAGRGSAADLALVVTAVVAIGLVGAGAYIALLVSRRSDVPAAAD